MYFQPRGLDEAVGQLARSGGTILAGGTDVFPGLGERPLAGPVIDITRVADLKGIACDANAWRLGAGVTWSEIIAAPLPPAFDGLKAAAREIGSVQIQNRATLGGNLCNASPAADSVPPLLCLDAEVELVSPRGVRTLPLNDFIRGNRQTARGTDEILSAVLVPRALDGGRSVFLKLGARRYLVISIAMVAVVVDVGSDGRVGAVRVAVGSCSAVARRLPAVEAALAGAVAEASLAGRVRLEHLKSLTPIDDIRATALYRREAALTLVRRAVATAAGAA